MADEEQINPADGANDESQEHSRADDDAPNDSSKGESKPEIHLGSKFDPDRIYNRTHAPDLTACPNCGRELVGQYCARCGQNNRINRLYFRSMLVAFIQEAFEIEGPLIRTFGKMWTKPGEVCRDYIEGRRRRYMSPVRYFLMSSIVYVLCISIPGMDQTEGVRAVMPQPDATNVSVTMKAPENPTDEQVAETESRRNRIRRNLAYFMTPEGQEQFRDDMAQKGPTIQLVLSPFLAAFLLVLYYDKRMCFAEHLVFLLYTKSQLTIVAVLALLLGVYSTPIGSLALMLIVPVLYSSWAAMRFYREHPVLALLRQSAALLVLVIMSGLAGIAIVLFSVFFIDAPAHFQWEPPVKIVGESASDSGSTAGETPEVPAETTTN